MRSATGAGGIDCPQSMLLSCLFLDMIKPTHRGSRFCAGSGRSVDGRLLDKKTAESK
jgi:hypothetical protein